MYLKFKLSIEIYRKGNDHTEHLIIINIGDVSYVVGILVPKLTTTDTDTLSNILSDGALNNIFVTSVFAHCF